MINTRSCMLACAALTAFLLAPSGVGLGAAEGSTRQAESRALPGDLELLADRISEDPERDLLVLEGSVTVSAGGARIQADRITLSGRRYLVAEGHVLLIWEGNRIAGTRLMYDLEEDNGVIDDAMGQVQSDYFFSAKRAEKRGKDKVHLESATVTTCTQPTAYWSFSVSSARIRLNQYAHMLNVRLNTGKLPVIYLPYLMWPVRKDRAAGLLVPEIRTTRQRGRVINQELFIPIGRSADLTLLARYYTEAGLGGGGTLRFIPNRSGEAELSGFYIRDKVLGGEDRYRAAYRQTQQFRNGFRMIADINLVSDFNYYSDFERALNLVSSPTILARLEFSRNGPWTSLNVRDLRREQLFSGGDELIQQTLPEIEWRGRSRRLGKTPLYLSFQSSLASIEQFGVQQGFDIDADYLRGDFFPELLVPISPVPWLDVNTRVRYRVTHYTQQQSLIKNEDGLTLDRELVDSSLTRTLFGAGIEIVGPKFFKIYERPNSKFSKRYKHTFEPNMTYGFFEDYERADDVLVFDEVDRFSGAGAQLDYGLRTRLFAKRPRAAAPAPLGMGEKIVLPGGPDVVSETAYEDPDGAAGDQAGEPVEIATFEIRQSRSFERDLSLPDFDPGGQAVEGSPYSSVQLFGRFNPSRALSLDLRSRYDIRFDRVGDVTLSGTVNNPVVKMRFSLVHREGLGASRSLVPEDPADPSGPKVEVFTPRLDDTQLRLSTGFSLFRNKLQINLDGSFDANPREGQARIPDKHWRVVYATQCCTFMVEKLNRDFTAEPRRDLYFRVDLKGLGKLLDTSF